MRENQSWAEESAYRVLALIHLVTNSVLGGLSTGSDGGVGVFGDILVGLLGSTRGELVHLVTDVAIGELELVCDTRERRGG